MIVAIIDLGTNTFNLLITEVFNDGATSVVFQTKIPVMLGKESIENHILSDSAIKRALDALKNFNTHIKKHGASKVIAKATSAIREAQNGKSFTEKALKETGIKIDVISGEEEAEYIYHGVCGALSLNDSSSLMMDIGGGSTEFIIADKNGVKWKHSFLLGAARLLERTKPSDPITTNEIKKLEEHFRIELKPMYSALKEFPIAELIGVAGVFESIAEIIGHRHYFPELIKGKTEYTFNLEEFEEVRDLIVKSTHKQRTQIKGLIAMRVDMIVVSIIFINLILKEFNIKKLRMSTYSLKEGVLRELIHGKKQ